MQSPSTSSLLLLFHAQSLLCQLETEFSWDKKNPWVNRGGDGKFQGNTGGAGQVANYLKEAKEYIDDFDLPSDIGSQDTEAPDLGGGSALKNSAIASAMIAGIPATAYLLLRLRYRSNFDRSAKLVKALAKEIKVPDELVTTPRGRRIECNQMTIFTTGFDAQEGKIGTHFMSESLYKDENYEKYFEGNFFSPFLNKDFNVKEAIHKGGKVPSPMDIVKGVIKKDPKVMEYPNAIVNGFKVMIDKAVNVGYNESAIKMAAQAKAFHDKHGDKAGLNLLGYSAGGMITHEAAELLDKLGIKAKVVNLGSPWYMLTKKVGPSVTITSKQDDVMNFTPVRDALHIDSVRSHVLYFKDKEVLSFLGRFMSSNIDDADDLKNSWRTLSDKFDIGDKGKRLPDRSKINKRKAESKKHNSKTETTPPRFEQSKTVEVAKPEELAGE
jgi:hypothetical protein